DPGTLHPALDGPFEKSRRLAEIAQADAVGVKRVQPGEQLNQRCRNRSTDRAGVESRREMSADDKARPVLHDEEVRAESIRIDTMQKRARGIGVSAPDGLQNPMLSFHVVGAGRDRAEGRPAQDVRRAVEVDQEIQVAEAARELARRWINPERVAL